MVLTSDIGSEGWWQKLRQQGTPVIGSASEGAHQVTFYWRDPEGDESRSTIQHVWINITGITDHHQQMQPQSLQRIAGTDVWQWQTRLDARWRGSYSLIPQSAAEAAQCPPATHGDMQQMRNWWRELFAAAQGDILNPLHSWKSGRGHTTSPLHMPLAPPQPYWLAAEQQPRPPHHFNSYQWHSERLGNSRTVWVITTGGAEPTRRPLAILLDGRFWAHTMPIGAPLQAMTDDGELPPAVYLLIDSVDTQQRSRELPCNADFWLAVQEELLPQLRGWTSWDNNAVRTVVAGQSFGGLSAVYAALHWPQQFGCALSLSGSFWWPRRDSDEGWLLQQIAGGLANRPPLRFYLEAGLNEPLITRVNDRLSQQLRAAGHQVDYQKIYGGHDALCWRGGLTEGLKQLWSVSK